MRRAPPAPRLGGLSILCGCLLSAGAACGGAATGPDIRLAHQPVVYEGVVSTARGALVHEGESCRIEIDRTSHPRWRCRVRVHCGDELVYGLADAGYNVCREEGGRFVAAEDPNGTRRDGDPRMQFDLALGRLVISDDDPHLYLVVGLPRPP